MVSARTKGRVLSYTVQICVLQAEKEKKFRNTQKRWKDKAKWSKHDGSGGEV
jgi:hypothetical protein